MISPRFKASDIQGIGAPDGGDQQPNPVHIHLHVPPQIASAFMQLVTAFTTQRSLFGQDVVADVTSQNQSQNQNPFRSHPTQAGGLGTVSEPAATTQNDTPGEPATDGTDRESLLGAYLSRLQDKRGRKAGESTLSDHRTSMRIFDEFCAWRQTQAEAGTDSPDGNLGGLKTAQTSHRLYTPVRSLAERDILTRFAEWLIRNRELSDVTACRRLLHVSMMAKELKIDVDKPAPLEVHRLWQVHQDSKADTQLLNLPTRKIPAFAEIDALAKAVHVTQYPYGEHAPYFWRGWIRYLALYGPRSRDVVSTIPRKIGLKKSDVIFESLCPLPDVCNALGRELHSPHGWLWYEIGKDRGKCRRILVPMPKWLRDWVRFFFELSWHPERVFPSCQKGSKSLTTGPMSEEWQRLLEVTNVDRRLIASEGKGDKIALRKYAANWWQLAVLQHRGDSQLADKVSHYVLHHREVTTAARHYLSVQAAVLPVMIELLERWPKPAGDAPPVSLLPE